MPPVEVVTKKAKGVVMVLGQLPTELAQLGHRLLLVSWGGCPTSGSWARSSHPGFNRLTMVALNTIGCLIINIKLPDKLGVKSKGHKRLG